jgi:hypothetical protein
MFMRRRPLLRAAVVGGGAYMAGKRGAQRSADQAQQEAYQDARISDLEGGRGASPAVPPARAAPGSEMAQAAQPSMTDQLAQLSRLHEQGALTDAEFAAAKSQLISG